MKLIDTFTIGDFDFFVRLDAQGNEVQENNDTGVRTVYDKNTGLYWEVKCKNTDCLHFGENTYDFNEAAEYANTLNGENYGGFSDWRLPNADELRTIMDYDGTDIAIDTSLFGYCQVGDYWTKNSFGPHDAMAWVIYSGFGSAIVKSKVTKHYVIAVRGGNDRRFGESDNARFVDNQDGTVTDLSTGLMWQQGENERASLKNAKRLCSEMDLAGYHDWRLPTIKEINTIQDLSYGNSSWFFDDFFPAQGVSGMLHYRASTIFKNHYSWVTNFSMGYDGYYAGFEAPLLFRAVRHANGDATATISDTFRITHTGESITYNLNGEPVPKDAFAGLDAERITLPMKFEVIKQDVTIKDVNTGLTWELIYAGDHMSFAEAKEKVAKMNQDAYGGHRDWRLPYREELRSIMLYDDSIPAVPAEFKKAIKADFYWTCQEDKSDSTLAWTVYAGYGCAVISNQNESAGVIAVRGREGLFSFDMSSSKRFVNNDDGTVSDLLTGLMWMQAETPLLNLTESLAYCKECRLAGYNDWNLPNMKELGTLINLTEGDQWFFTEFFPETNIAPQGFYMSSTTFDASFGWGCNFQFGFDGYYADRRNGKYPFRPVRMI